MSTVTLPSSHADAVLARRVGAGDATAFATLDNRHRKALTRYAGSLLRRSEHDAEDVVQDVLIRAHAALCCGEGPEELRPWLYRLVRNRAIDEIRRARWGHEALEAETSLAGARCYEPAAVLRRRESMRRLVEDLAGLPRSQRTALLARELDGFSAEEVAVQLGVSVAAAQKLAMRARENLVKMRAARDATCSDVRELLLDARERGVRTTEHALRHTRGCRDCHAYQRDIRRLSKQLHALNPAVGVPLLAAAVKLVVAAFGSSAAVSATATLMISTTGGVVVMATNVYAEGDHTPFQLHGMEVGDPSRSVVPRGSAVVTARVLAPGGDVPRSVTLLCPKAMRLTGLAPTPGPARVALSPGSVAGSSTRARIDLLPEPDRQAQAHTVGIVCRRRMPTDRTRVGHALLGTTATPDTRSSTSASPCRSSLDVT
jgi:RNA polymerase sigma factor (sigma-70 family)